MWEQLFYRACGEINLTLYQEDVAEINFSDRVPNIEHSGVRAVQQLARIARSRHTQTP